MANKVTVIGTGNFGSTVAFILAMRGACHEVVLRGRNLDIAKGKALDMSQAANAAREHTVVRAGAGPEDMAGSKIVVITAGAPRTPGMSRDDLLTKNAKIVKAYALEIKEHAPDAIVVVVSNPLDVMTYVALKFTGFPRERVLGDMEQGRFARLSWAVMVIPWCLCQSLQLLREYLSMIY